MTPTHNIILAIESAICGGSISLLRDGVKVDSWTGTSSVSKAEDLLANIDEMLVKNRISRQEINLIAASAGPGSFTGIRIGLATALGLKAGLGIRMSSETALKAMAFSQKIDGTIVAALPVGRDAVCVQTFQTVNREVVALDGPRTITELEFAAVVGREETTTFLVHSTLNDKVGGASNIKSFGANIALAIAHICRKAPGIIMEPLFISKSF